MNFNTRKRVSTSRKGNSSSRASKANSFNIGPPLSNNLIYPTVQYSTNPFQNPNVPSQQVNNQQINLYLNQYFTHANNPASQTADSQNMFAYQNYVKLVDQQQNNNLLKQNINQSNHTSQLDTIQEDYNDISTNLVIYNSKEKEKLLQTISMNNSFESKNNQNYERRIHTSQNNRKPIMTQNYLRPKIQTPSTISHRDGMVAGGKERSSEYFSIRNKRRGMSTIETSRSRYSYSNGPPSSKNGQHERFKSHDNNNSWLPQTPYDIMNIQLVTDNQDPEGIQLQKRKLLHELQLSGQAKSVHINTIMTFLRRLEKKSKRNKLNQLYQKYVVNNENTQKSPNEIIETLRNENQNTTINNNDVINELEEDEAIDEQQAQSQIPATIDSHQENNQTTISNQPTFPNQQDVNIDQMIQMFQDYSTNGPPSSSYTKWKLQEQHLIKEFEQTASNVTKMEKRLDRIVNELRQRQFSNQLFESRGMSDGYKMKSTLSQVLLLISQLKRKVYTDLKTQEDRSKSPFKYQGPINSCTTNRKIQPIPDDEIKQDLPGYKKILSPNNTASPQKSNREQQMAQKITDLEQKLRDRTDKFLSQGACFEIVHQFKVYQSKKIDQFQAQVNKLRDQVRIDNECEVNELLNERKSLQIEAYRLTQMMKEKIDAKVKNEAKLIIN